MPDSDFPLDTFDSLDELAAFVFGPGRREILTALSSTARADRTFLQNATGLDVETFDRSLGELEETGFVDVLNDDHPDAPYHLNDDARRTIAIHWDDLQALYDAGD